jgi:serine/threonine protein kinase
MGTDPFGLVGSVLDGQYRVDAWVGEGGFSVVYRGLHLGLNELVAIKCHKPLADFPDAVADFLNRFKDESRIAYRLSQGNLDIVRCIASGTHTLGKRPLPYMVLEWLEGQPLSTVFRDRRAAKHTGAPFQDIFRLFAPAAEALAYAHSQGVIHRDVKPGNLFLAKTREGGVRLKVLDFGMAKFMAESASDGPNPGFSRLAMSVGNIAIFSAPYAAPEQFDPAMGAIGAFTDVYSFALVFLEALTDRRVRTGEGLAECLVQACKPSTSLTVRQLLTGRPALPPAVERALERAISTKPSERQQNMGQFLGELRNAMQGDSKQSDDPSTWSSGDSIPPEADGPATIVANTSDWADEPPKPPKPTESEESTRTVDVQGMKPGQNLPQDVKDFLARTGAAADKPPHESGTGRAAAAIKGAGLPPPRPFARTIAGGFGGAQGKPSAPRAAGMPALAPPAAPVKVTEAANGGAAPQFVLPAIPAAAPSSPADITTPHTPMMSMDAVGDSGDSEPPTLALMSASSVGADRIPGQSDMPTMIGAPPALDIPRAAPTGVDNWAPPTSQPQLSGMQAPVPGLPLPQPFAGPDSYSGPANPMGRTLPLSPAYEQQAINARAAAQQHIQQMGVAATAPAPFPPQDVGQMPGQYGQAPQQQPYGAFPGGAPGQPGMAPAPGQPFPGAPWQQPGAPLPPQQQQAVPRSRMMVVGVLAGLAVLLLLGVGYGLYSLISSRSDPAVDGIDMSATAAATSAAPPATPAAPAVTAAETASAQPAAPATQSAAPVETAAPTAAAVAEKPAEKATEKAAEKPPEKLGEKAVAESTKSASTSTSTPTSTSTSRHAEKTVADPTKFNADAAKASLRTMEGMLASCKKPDGPTGSGRARVAFGNDGNVISSAIVGPPFEGTPVGDCVANRLKFAKAPKFEGPPGVLDYTFTVSR